jgi:FAD/FMN-containing dehydrogenase
MHAFVPAGAPVDATPVHAVKAGAGAVWIDLHEAVTTRGGRYVQVGGFGSFSKGFGTSSGNLLEAEVVTADGAIITVNPDRRADLFWALKGGCGSLGVITSLTLRTHDLPATFGSVAMGIKATSDAAYTRLVLRFMAFYAEHLFNPQWGRAGGHPAGHCAQDHDELLGTATPSPRPCGSRSLTG